MFKKYLLFIIISMPLISQAQNIMPVLKGKPALSKKIRNQIVINDKEIKDVQTEMNKSSIAKVSEIDQKKTKDALVVKMAYLLVKKDSLQKIKKVCDTSLVSFYASAAIGGGTDFLSTITSSGQLNAVVNPFGQTYIGVGANLLFANPESGVNKDSVGLNTLMFPETGKFGVFVSVSQKIHISPNGRPDPSNEFRQHFLVPQFSFAYRRVSIDSLSTGFKVLNYNFGLKYQVEGITAHSDRVVFSIMPYYHFFNIPDEDVFHFHKFVSDSLFLNNNRRAEIQALGIKTTLQYNSFVFFFDIRRNMKTSKNMADENPFKGTIVNVGFTTNFKLSLNKKKEDDN